MAALAATPAGGGVDLASALGANSLMVAADGTPTMCGEIHTVDISKALKPKSPWDLRSPGGYEQWALKVRQGVAQLAGKDFLEQAPPTRANVAAAYPDADTQAVDEAFQAISTVYSQRQGQVFAYALETIEPNTQDALTIRAKFEPHQLGRELLLWCFAKRDTSSQSKQVRLQK